MNSLYNIAEDAIALEMLLAEDQPGGHDEKDLDVVAKWLEEMAGTLDAKLVRCIAYMREQTLLAAAADEEAKRLAEIKRIRLNRVERVKKAIQYVFEVGDIRRVETKLGAVTLAENGGQQALEVFRPVDELPREHVKITTAPDNDSIRARLEAGETLTFARLKPRGFSVRIR